jgi:palmitoyltransferase
MHVDPFLVSVTAWATLQLSWTILLLASQYWQIARNMTTFEVSNLGRYGFMGGRGGQSLQNQMGHRHQHGHGQGQGSGEDVPHKHASGMCGSGFLMQILGFDRFTKGKAADGLARAGTAPNPFNLGFMGNCKDFWTNGRELGVEYNNLFDVPAEGFTEAKRRKEMEADEEHGAGGTHKKANSLRSKLLMGFTLGRGNREGYEPVSQV